MGSAEFPTYLEIGAKRTFAGALEWPGWCRAGRDEAAALEALHGAGPRYARVLRGARLGFEPPTDPSRFTVVERLQGDVTTDFGAPAITPKADARPIEDAELRRSRSILRACWRSFDAAVDGARGKTLAKGPRGGGRDLRKIVDHVVDAEGSYLRMAGRRVEAGSPEDLAERIHAAVLETLETTARHGPPPPGPRGGTRWLPRYFVRRVTWHVLDHAWEIADRAR
jgi:hypothetical protein